MNDDFRWRRHTFSCSLQYKAHANYFYIQIHVCCVGKQFSLDSRMDLVFHGINTGVRAASGSAKVDETNRAITEDGEESWEGTKGR